MNKEEYLYKIAEQAFEDELQKIAGVTPSVAKSIKSLSDVAKQGLNVNEAVKGVSLQGMRDMSKGLKNMKTYADEVVSGKRTTSVPKEEIESFLKKHGPVRKRIATGYNYMKSQTPERAAALNMHAMGMGRREKSLSTLIGQ